MFKFLLVISVIFFTESSIAEEKTTSTRLHESLLGNQNNFLDLKKKRRAALSQIDEIQTKISELTKEVLDLEEGANNYSDEDSIIRNISKIDEWIEKSKKKQPIKDGKNNNFNQSTIEKDESFNIFLNRSRLSENTSPEDLQSRKAEYQSQLKYIQSTKFNLNQKRSELVELKKLLEKKKLELIDVEDAISEALSSADKVYIFRALVSLIFAGIVAFLVFKFFNIVQDNEQIKTSIFTGDAGIQFVTLFSIVIAVILFGILEILKSNELSALLGGLSGYILGRSTPKREA